MSRLGNWTTIDCPTEKQEEAFKFLVSELNGIAIVRKVMNPHEFGDYPSLKLI